MATWDVRSLLDDTHNAPRRKTAILAQELRRYHIDIAALSETRLSGEGSITEDDYTIFWRGYTEGHTRLHGVGLAVHRSITKKKAGEHTFHNERLLSLRIPLVRNEHVHIITAYAPTLVSDEDKKDRFYSELTEILRGIDPRDKVLLLGDFNARVGARRDLWGYRTASYRIRPVGGYLQSLLEIAGEVLGSERPKDRDWFAENAEEIRDILKKKQ